MLGEVRECGGEEGHDDSNYDGFRDVLVVGYYENGRVMLVVSRLLM